MLRDTCSITGNYSTNADYSARVAGSHSTLNNCSLAGNWTSGHTSGGASFSTLNNCITYSNTAAIYSNTAANYYSCGLNYCCTTPMPYSGSGNITNLPLFLNPAAGDLRLQSNSPCINAGNNAYAPNGGDLGGNPRTKGGAVDMGAYEFQTPQLIISYAWSLQHGMSTDGSADHADPDNDHFDNYSEWRAGTEPFDASSALRVLCVSPGTNGTLVMWQSVNGI